MADLKPILLVEDNPLDMELTLEALRDAKVPNGVVVARDGAEALDCLLGRGTHAGQAVRPALIILDLKLPKVDGIEVLQTIKSDPNLKDVPVVMLTGSAHQQRDLRVQGLEASAFLLKPFRLEEFLGVLHRVPEPPGKLQAGGTTVRPVVLVAENEVLVRMLIADVLEDEGYKVLEAADATEALRVLEARPDVHVVVTDVEMPPGLNGVELAHQVQERWPYIQVLVTSGRVFPTELPEGTVFVPKPWTAESLARHVREAVERAGRRPYR